MTKEEIMEAIEDAEVIESREIGGRCYDLYNVEIDGTEISVIDNDDANAERFIYVLKDSTQVLKNLDSVEDGSAELMDIAEVY